MPVSACQPASVSVGAVRYCPILDRLSQSIGYRLFVLEPGVLTAGRDPTSASLARDALALQIADRIDTDRLLALAAAEPGTAPATPVAARYWLPASIALLDGLMTVPPQASSTVWLLPAALAIEPAARARCQATLARAHRLALIGSAAELAAVAPLAGLTAMHVLGRVGGAAEALYRHKRAGALLIRAAAAHEMQPTATHGAPTPDNAAQDKASLFDGNESFGSPSGARAVTAPAGTATASAPTYGFVLKALQLLQSEAQPEQIEAVLRVDPVLVFRLLRYANAAAFRGDQPIDGLAMAIRRVGSRQFSRWLALGLVTSQVDRGGHRAPIARAVIRGLTMEIVARRGVPASVRDAAFMVGLFSLIDGIVGAPLATLVEAAALSSDARDALLQGRGDAYRLLTQAIGTEWSASHEADAAINADVLQATDLALIDALRLADGLL